MPDTNAARDRLNDSLALLPGWQAAPPQYDPATHRWTATAHDVRRRERARPQDSLAATGETEAEAVDGLARLLWLRATG